MSSLSQGAAPVDKYASGAAVGLGLGLFPIAGLGVLVGLAMYLPFPITLTYGLGCLTAIWLEKRKGKVGLGIAWCLLQRASSSERQSPTSWQPCGLGSLAKERFPDMTIQNRWLQLFGLICLIVGIAFCAAFGAPTQPVCT